MSHRMVPPPCSRYHWAPDTIAVHYADGAAHQSVP